jgi:hypothetical protein
LVSFQLFAKIEARILPGAMLFSSQESNTMSVEKLVKRSATTQKQIEANRRNARKSSGPITPSGRAISSQNARKYDLLPFENPKLPAQLTAQYYGRYVPANKGERRLVDIMIFSDRVRRHCSALEDRIYSDELANIEGRSMAEAMTSASRRLMMVDYRREAAECAHTNALRQLKAVRVKAA